VNIITRDFTALVPSHQIPLPVVPVCGPLGLLYYAHSSVLTTRRDATWMLVTPCADRVLDLRRELSGSHPNATFHVRCPVTQKKVIVWGEPPPGHFSGRLRINLIIRLL
jgi:hypothetical protein